MEYLAPVPGNAQPLSAEEVADLVGGAVQGQAEVQIQGVADLASAGPRQATFLSAQASAEVITALNQSRAGLILVRPDDSLPSSKNFQAGIVRVENAALAAALLAQHFDLARPRATGVHDQADVHPRAKIGVGVTIYRGVFVGAGCVVGPGCVLHSGVVLYPGTILGSGCIIHANSVLGSDGFGYVWSGETHQKVPQQGYVQIGDGVEIGACTTIDCGTFGATEIGDGCIIDNQVQIGHNCKIGRLVVLCAQVGLSGSTEIGDGAMLAGRAASSGHLRIGAGVRMAGAAVATKDIADGRTVGGYPAWDLHLEKRALAKIRALARG
jgi:UDP-3-O-[3-hydroxymyristoyl] glucosamine N-acyltransferase